ncbi:hypothetical protein EDB92DRAFT_1947979 [Lactarius akahatsu]|uniref:Ubiquitin-like domain-containing protein n=1 Tax=Lactarius akahatsu TaxID=416441 RepID=A0AAD4Q9G8_9AGAM|nr:hypothetical protein EDB92DRAFT_1947979 [Lactarius akahatsu]
MLRRAGDAPLELTLSEQFVPFPPSKCDAPTVISQLLHRVSALTIKERAFTLPVLDSLTSPAPLLDTLSITSSQLALLPQSLISANAPKLRDLYLRNVLPAWTTAIFTGLKRLCVVLDRHMDASHVPTYPELFDTLQVHAPPRRDRMIQVPNLQHLFLAGHTFGCHQILKHLNFPREAVVSVTCLTDDLTGQDCCNILPLLISRLPRPSLGTLDVSWKDRFDRAFNISGDSTWHEDEDAKQPRAEQKVRMLKAVCAALPTDELRVLTGNLDLGTNAWSEVLGGHQRLQHIRVGSLSTLRSFVLFLSQEGVYPDLKSLTLFNVDLCAKPDDTIALMKQLNSNRPPKLSTVVIDACRLRRELVLAMKAAAPDLEIRWDGNGDESPEGFDKFYLLMIFHVTGLHVANDDDATLPTYSHSFHVSVPSTGTINDLKREIEKACPGNPRMHGQRLIWQGRVLSDDEKMLDIWRSPSDSPIVHLAVHPSAWPGSPPSVATPANFIRAAAGIIPAVLPPAPTGHSADGYFPAHPPPAVQYAGPPPRPAQPSTGLPPSASAALPAPTSIPGLAPISVGYINFVAFQHLRAAMVLRRGHATDDEYPPPQNESAGIKYEPVTIDGQDYLKLVDPSKTPTPLQAHALRVLEHTFALLAMPVPGASANPMSSPASQGHSHLPVHVGAHLRQIGLAPLRVRQENAMIAELRAVPMRALAAPLFMLTLRTLFLLYFFSPFQKPVFGLIVTVWLLYETWNTIRNAIPRLQVRDHHHHAVDEDARILGNARVRPAEAVHQQGPDAALRAQAPPPVRAHAPRPRPPSTTMMDTLANINLREELGALDARPEAIAAPTIGHRIKTFVELLMLTAHPAVWDRRRAALRQREGRVRTEMNVREASQPVEGDGDAQANEARARARAALSAIHTRRPAWVVEYMERVRGGDWVDDQ